MKRKLIAAALAAVTALSGCTSSRMYQPSESTPAASYSISELTDMVNAEGLRSKYFDDRSEADMSDEALKAYNNMLGYAEEKLGGRAYKLYDFYKVDFETVKSYVVKIVLDEYKDSDDHDNAPIMISCDLDGSHIKSALSGFIYAREWTEQLGSEINALYPDYHLNTFYLQSEHLVLSINDTTYDTAGIGNTELSGDWDINLILPVGTSEEDFAKAYGDIKPVLDKYSVTELNVIEPDSQSSYDDLINKETITGNCYYYITDGLDWIKRGYSR